ncbi:hypothetical protein FLJC2902T_14210 [Flavobacterium limnosediminis JC2902]|uniref:Uncharacterized protein n=1 Tax=Flavobacterium limnosediminis JC2902 TaxID=1341181 RepID=V6SQU7_9FLAO|nr:hypothetical protein [Flavobacterium limnosediminis]ESU28824.1 hypothetical protein FLJC2902T_14210 [Flavobacterium limnosediminis JC2902]
MATFKKFSGLLLLVLLFSVQEAISCSMYKITLNGKTIVGCNEDAWRTTSRIWFETRNHSYQYGAAFSGSRFDGSNGFAPQSGMNEHGLCYSRLASNIKKKDHSGFENRLKITNPTAYLKDILHNCKTVDDVQKFISRYDHSFFLEDVFIYVESSGKYLVVEPYLMTVGYDSKYVLSNFCPSETSTEKAMQLTRYRNGVAFLKDKMDTSLAFCTALSDTMSVCREKIGDGTLLTSIWNPKDGTVNLYFYHNYQKSVEFNINEELTKGNHSIEISKLFPKNEEFEKLATYQTPQNNGKIRLFLIGIGLIPILTSLYFTIQYFRNKKQYAKYILFFLPFGLVLFYYMFVLCTDINIFYFKAPYKHYSSAFVSSTSYIPFLLLLLIIPIGGLIIKTYRNSAFSKTSKFILTLNFIGYITLIGWFIYWGFYNIF